MTRYPEDQPEGFSPDEIKEILNAVRDIVEKKGKGRYGFTTEKSEIRGTEGEPALEIDITINDQQKRDSVFQVHVLAMKNRNDPDDYTNVYLAQVKLEKGRKEITFLQTQTDESVGNLWWLEQYERDIKALVALVAG